MTTKLILASASPRRVELLNQMQLEFEQQIADIDEIHRSGESAEEFVCRLALEKAQAIKEKNESEVAVLGSDTIVVLNEEILGKPENKQQAAEMLSLLSAKTHQVMTAVSLVTAVNEQTLINISEVTFMPLSNEMIEAYLATGESMDKAGAYAVQGIAAQFITEIKGSYSGIMGLPLYETRCLLKDGGIKLVV